MSPGAGHSPNAYAPACLNACLGSDGPPRQRRFCCQFFKQVSTGQSHHTTPHYATLAIRLHSTYVGLGPLPCSTARSTPLLGKELIDTATASSIASATAAADEVRVLHNSEVTVSHIRTWGWARPIEPAHMQLSRVRVAQRHAAVFSDAGGIVGQCRKGELTIKHIDTRES